MRFLSKVTLAIAAMALIIGFSVSVQAKEWRGWNIHVAGYPNTVAMDKFAELLKEKSGGKMTVKMYHSGTLGSQPDAIEQLRIGGIEIGNFNLGPLGPIVPEANVVSLPFIFKDVDHMWRVLDGKAGDIINEGMTKFGIVPLAWYDAGARSFYNSKKPIMKPEDVTGMKVRVMNNDLYSGMISALGGNPSPMAFAEVYQSLKTGVVDGAENNWPSYESTGHFEVAQFYSMSQHLIIPETLCVNAKVWQGLSPEDQKILKEAAVESAMLQRKLWKEREKASEEKVLAGGVQFNEIPDKSGFQAAMKPVYEKFLKDNPNLKTLVETIQNTP
ncbi:MAG: TRAP transporter substrate-binding protein [Desulfofustis sp.]|nr:TRAP transporter substrate-binding protein [Desulfofustis sp.]MBT8346458.1 TRAP transporter substrate-binding protein [Desulfofustis sp.]MBT8353267.1 TRAP transporter substrate-binding protein [Desulfofustis sp.]NNF45585.1 TRAP transporter substrate-binding protein [Desulfofustis sp.]NNK12700.1 TRAP transporter substrate-binding protein [Desulfofustis sp.]